MRSDASSTEICLVELKNSSGTYVITVVRSENQLPNMKSVCNTCLILTRKEHRLLQERYSSHLPFALDISLFNSSHIRIYLRDTIEVVHVVLLCECWNTNYEYGVSALFEVWPVRLCASATLTLSFSFSSLCCSISSSPLNDIFQHTKSALLRGIVDTSKVSRKILLWYRPLDLRV